MGKLLQFIKKPQISMAEYGRILWNAMFNREPDIKYCPDCGHKLQWIKVDTYSFNNPIFYWGCMKCKLKTTKIIQGVKVGYKASLS